jgi:hypothetical protein
MSAPASILPDPSAIAALPAEALPALLVQLAALQGAVAARLLEDGQRQATAASAPDTMISLEDGASRIGQTPDWLKRHARKLPFVKRISRKRWLVSETALNRWVASRKA